MCQDPTKSLSFAEEMFSISREILTGNKNHTIARKNDDETNHRKFGWGNFTISIINVIIEGRDMKNEFLYIF